jgi:molybdenum cofactor biosynthesis enzyme MoaA
MPTDECTSTRVSEDETTKPCLSEMKRMLKKLKSKRKRKNKNENQVKYLLYLRIYKFLYRGISELYRVSENCEELMMGFI